MSFCLTEIPFEMKKTGLFGLVLVAFICLHCSEAEDPGMDCWLPSNSLACEVLTTILDCPVVPVAGADDDITGKWKLVMGRTVFYEPHAEDYSCNDIVYHFQADGRLTVSANIEDAMGVSSGQYEYELKRQPLFENFNRDYTLTIGNEKDACSIFEGSMILDNSPLDGPVLHLIRIQ